MPESFSLKREHRSGGTFATALVYTPNGAVRANAYERCVCASTPVRLPPIRRGYILGRGRKGVRNLGISIVRGFTPNVFGRLSGLTQAD